jgi:hypothetical protein
MTACGGGFLAMAVCLKEIADSAVPARHSYARIHLAAQDTPNKFAPPCLKITLMPIFDKLTSFP